MPVEATPPPGLYAKGLTTGDIQQHLLEIYGTEISTESISKITDQIVEKM
ncbi:MAG: transposase, partial [Actinobacteria bacterium]|nr:transposase [Actinomycetota bacterium]